MIIKVIEDSKNPVHVHGRIFEGPHEGALGLCGKLVMSPNAWDILNDALEEYSKTGAGHKLTFVRG